MEIIKIKVMRGPNCWSAVHHKLIVLKIKPDTVDAYPYKVTDVMIEVTDDLIKRLEGLRIPPQFLYRGQTLTELIGHVAVALQRLCGMDCPYFSEQAAGLNADATVIFPYEVENAGVYAARASIKIINDLVSHTSYTLETEMQELSRISRRQRLGPSTKAIAQAALNRNIPVTRLDDDSLIMLGQGAQQRIIRAAVASSTSAIAVELAQDKDSTKKILKDNYIPIPPGVITDELDQLVNAIDEIGFPLVIKPSDGNHGRGITTMIQSQAEAVKAFQLAQQVSEDVIVEKHIQGDDYRFLVINYKLVAVAKRTPALVTGDGISSITQLVTQTNKDPRRGPGHEQVLTNIVMDEDTLAILATLQLTPDTILDRGRTVYLKSTANLSTGGTAEDVTDMVHPHNKALAERVARLMDLDICGIDMMAARVDEPITEANGAVLEVNAGPGLRMHLAPSKGLARDVAAPIVEMLYPADTTGRIPLVAITGTNGKTTTVRLIAHIAKQVGYHTGFTTTDGIYINDKLILQGDCSGPQSARVVLRDPLVNFAVLECARGGILRSGLGFDQCGVSIVTNVSADHLGLDGIESIEQLAKIKAVVPQSTAVTGYAILNADDDLVYQMKDSVKSNLALFSLDAGNPRIRRHMAMGKLAAFTENGWFVVFKENQKHKIALIADVPLTFRGTAECMIKNVLPAILAACIHQISFQQIKHSLLSFKSSPENTPGRMNHFQFTNFCLMLDYAHNEGGYGELKKYAAQVTASVKTGVIAAAGDRRDQDIRNLGALAAEIFDEIIIRHDKDGRGRTNEQITSLLTEGIRKIKPNMRVRIISDEIEAIAYAIMHAEKDSWVFVNTDEVQEALAFVSQAHENDLHNHGNTIAA
jgi:cyanophycin synthetase